MNSTPDKEEVQKHFFLEKWFLDFVTEKGDAYIFYAAKMHWHKITIPFKSQISWSKLHGEEHKKMFYGVTLPRKEKEIIRWSDNSFKVEGSWQANTGPLSARLFESPEGGLQWNCFQPASLVKIKINNKEFSGQGYAEQLILTVEPWKIPMNELRWGRFVAGENNLVWIEIKGAETKQWVWYNGKKIDKTEIKDQQVILPSENIHLDMNESRPVGTINNITQVIKKLTSFIPGFRHSVPLNFLMAEEHKWISKGNLYKDGLLEHTGWVIHEKVIFNK